MSVLFLFSLCTSLPQAILEMVAAADLFMFEVLKEELGGQLFYCIHLETVLPLLVHSETYHLPNLRQHCFRFIKENAMAVLQSSAFVYLPEEDLIKIISRDTLVVPELAIFKAVVRWKEHNNSGVEQTARVLQHVRLSELSPWEIVVDVQPTKLFSQESIMTALRLQHTPSVTENRGRGKISMVS